MHGRFSAVAVVLALTLCAPTTQAQEASGGWKQTVFIVGSDLTWQVLTTVRRQNTDRFGWYLGYRAIGFDYEDGKGRNYQRYDLTQQGPLAGISFSI